MANEVRAAHPRMPLPVRGEGGRCLKGGTHAWALWLLPFVVTRWVHAIVCGAAPLRDAPVVQVAVVAAMELLVAIIYLTTRPFRDTFQLPWSLFLCVVRFGTFCTMLSLHVPFSGLGESSRDAIALGLIVLHLIVIFLFIVVKLRRFSLVARKGIASALQTSDGTPGGVQLLAKTPQSDEPGEGNMNTLT